MWTPFSESGRTSLALHHMFPARESGDPLARGSDGVSELHLREGSKPHDAGANQGKSDEVMVPMKLVKTRVTPVESMEGRTEANGSVAALTTASTQSESTVVRLQRLQQRAATKTTEQWTNLLTIITEPLLTQAFGALRKNAAVGIDGVTWDQYAENLSANISALTRRVHDGTYDPLPVKRVFIAKADGTMRPLGLPALEDKIVQQAVRWVVEPIWESEFCDESYGYRPKRNAHQALNSVFMAICYKKVNWILDADIQSFFDTLDHGWLQSFIEHRIADKRLVRLLMKWLKAGVMDREQWRASEAGTPQGGLIGPLLANLYLHYVLDLWIRQWKNRTARGEVYYTRYCDDFVLSFQREMDAREFRKALAARLSMFKLTLHEKKTRVLEFGKFAAENRAKRGEKKPETFTFLGFTHIVVNEKQRTKLIRRTSGKKLRASAARVKERLKRMRHDPVKKQHQWLCQVLRGHDGYYGVPGNVRMLTLYRRKLKDAWVQQLQRRSQRARWNNEQRSRFESRFALPPPRICHPWPDRQRL